MTSIDSRVVTMKFDNSSFKAGVTSTLDMLAKLTTGIAGLGRTKGLNDISASANKVDLSPVGAQVEGISAKFLALSTVAVTALATITNKAVTAGIDLAKSFSIDPLLDGFAEYELKMGSIQTILANTDRYGTSLEEVTGALDELNEYADQTIYNFGDMTKNIGLFTNSGMRIEEATSVIKGFSNSAAASGTSAQGAAAAAYQLSQAFSTGTIRLMDWRSLTNVGLGNKNMQLGIIEIADAMGTLDAASITAQDVQADFNGSLEKGWLSAEVMSNYLTIMAGDMDEAKMASLGLTEEQIKGFARQQKIAEEAATKVRTFTQLMSTLKEAVASGWSETFNIVFGDFNEATDTFTAISQAVGGVLDGMSDARNRLLEGWADLGGRTALLEGLANIFKALANIIKPIKNAFRDIFPPATAAGLYRITEAFRDFTEGLIISGPAMKNIRTIYGAIFGVLGVGIDIVQGIIYYFADLVRLLAGGTGGFLDVAASVADVVFQLTQWLKQGDYIGRFFDTVIAGRAALLEPIIAAFSRWLSLLADIVSSGLGLAINGMGKAFEFAAPYVELVADKVAYLIDLLRGKLSEGFEAVKDSKDDLLEVAAVVEDKIIAAFEKVLPVLQQIKDAIFEAFGAVAEIGGSVAGSIGGAVSGFDGLGGLFGMGDGASDAEGGISKVTGALASVAPGADEARTAWDGFVNILKIGGMAVGGFFVGIGLLIQKGWEALGKAFQAAGGSAEGVFSAVRDGFSNIQSFLSDFFSKFDLMDILAVINTAFFIALYRNLSQFVSGLRDVAESASGVLDALTGNLETMQRDVKANIILKIAAAVGILAASVLVLSSIEPARLAIAVGAISALIFMLSKAVSAFESEGSDTFAGAAKAAVQMTSLSVAMVGFAIAVAALAVAVAIFGNMDTGTLVKGFASVAVAMGLMVAASAALGKFGGGAGLLAASAALFILSGALIVLSKAITAYAKIDFGTILSGSIKIVAILGALALALNFMNATVTGALALVIVAGALGLLIPVIRGLAELEWETVGKGLLVLVAVLGTLGVASLLLTPVVPILLGIGTAIVLLGAGAFLAGAGLLAFAAGITALVVAGGAGVAIMTAYVIGIAELFPLIMQQVGLGIRALAKVLSESGPEFFAALTTALDALYKAVRATTPGLRKTLSKLIRAGIDVLFTFYGDFIEAGVAFVERLIQGVERNVDRFARSATRAAIAFMEAVEKYFPKLVDRGFKMIIKLIDGVSDAIDANSGALREAGGRLAGSIIDGMTGGLLGRGIELVRSAAARVAEAIPGPIRKIMGINSPAKAMIPLGSSVGEGLALGIDGSRKLVGRSAEEVGAVALNTLSTTMRGLSDAVDTNLDFNPTITPVLDLSELTRDANRVSGLLAQNPMTANVSYASAADISNDVEEYRSTSGGNEPVTKTEVNFTQNNHSPKALSPVEIYRQTQNQLSLAKEALNA